MEIKEDDKNYLILFNNVKYTENSWPNKVSKAFDRAKTRFLAGKCSVTTIKIFDVPNTRNNNINDIINYVKNTFDIIIFSVFDKQSLKDGSIAVYYTGLDEEFNYKKEYKQKIRSDPGAVGNIYDNLYISNMDWEDFERWENDCEDKMVPVNNWNEVKDYIENIKIILPATSKRRR